MKNKKAFTIIELVIVLAIIAILAAVLIPTFARIIQKANISKDNQLIRNLNTALASDSAGKDNAKHLTMTDALRAAEAFGYDVGKINKSATDNEILWDSKNDVFCYFDNEVVANRRIDKIQYIPESSHPFDKNPTDSYDDDYVNLVDYWVISNSINTDGYSTYLFGYTDNGGVQTVDISAGLDVGSESIAKINYISTKGQTVSIRTNGGSLFINAPTDTVSHFGEGGILQIEAIGTDCYHEFGSFIYGQIKKGKIIIENADAKIENLLLISNESGDGFDTIILEIKNGAPFPVLDRTDVSIGPNGTLVLQLITDSTVEYIYLTKSGVIEQVYVTTELVDTSTTNVIGSPTAKLASATSDTTFIAAQQIANIGKKNGNGQYVDANGNPVDIDSSNIDVEERANYAAVSAGTNKYAGGMGTEKYPYLITNAQELSNVRDNLSAHYRVINDIDMRQVTDWEPIGSSSAPFSGHLDGDNYSVKKWNTTTSLFGIVNGSTPNSKLTGQKSDVLDDSYNLIDANVCECNYSCVIKNLNIEDSEIVLTIYMGGLADLAINSYIENCEIRKTKITYQSGWGTGTFIGEIFKSHVKGLHLTNDNTIICNNSPTYLGNSGLIIGMISGPSTTEYLTKDYVKSNSAWPYSTIVNGCVNDASATMNYTGGWIGSIVGSIYAYHPNQIIIDCTNNGDLTVNNLAGEVSIGGILGGHGGGGSVNFIRCSNAGKISLTGNSSISGDATGYDTIAGITAYANGPFIDCTNTGAISGNTTYISGICARANDSAVGVIFDNCINTGSLSSTNQDAKRFALCAYVPKADGKTVHVYNSNLNDLGINANDFTFHNGNITSGICKPTSTQTINTDPSTYSVVDLSSLSSGKITWNVSNADITIWGVSSNADFAISGTNNKVTVADNTQIRDITISGSGTTFINNGTIRNMFSQTSADITNKGQMAGVFFTGSESDNVHFTNRGTIDGNGWADYPYPVQTGAPINLTFDNFGTISTTKVAFAVLLYSNSNVTLNAHKNSEISSTNSSLTIFFNGGMDTQIANSVTINVEKGTTNGVNGNSYYNVSAGTQWSTSHNKSCVVTINWNQSFD